MPTITKELNQLLKLRNIKHSAEKTEGRYGELVNSIDMILKRKKFVAEKEVEAGVHQIERVKEQHDELIEELNIENSRCQERIFQAHMQKTSVRGDGGVGNQIFESENILKPIHHSTTAGIGVNNMKKVFKDWEMSNASG